MWIHLVRIFLTLPEQTHLPTPPPPPPNLDTTNPPAFLFHP